MAVECLPDPRSFRGSQLVELLERRKRVAAERRPTTPGAILPTAPFAGVSGGGVEVGLVAGLAFPDHVHVGEDQKAGREQGLLEGPAAGVDGLLVRGDARE